MTSIWGKIKNTFSGSKDITTIGFSTIISNVIAGLFWLYIASLLGTKHYGEISYFIAIASVASVISFLGANSTLTVYVAKGEKIQPVIFFISTTASLITSIILYFMYYNLGVSLYVIGFVIFSLSISEMLGLKSFKTYSIYLITQKALSVALAILFYFLIGPQGVIIGIAASFFPYIHRIYFGFRKAKIDFSQIKPRLGFMMNSYVLDLSRTFSSSVDKLIIAPIFGFELLGNYQLGVQVLNVLGILPSLVYQYILPHDASGNPNIKLKVITVIASVIITFLSIVLSPIVIPILFPKFTEAVSIIQIMSLATIPSSVIIMYISKFLGKEKVRIVLTSSVIYLASQIISIIIFGKLFGINGIAVSIVLATALESIFLASINQYMKHKNPNF